MPAHLPVAGPAHFTVLTADFTTPAIAATQCPCTGGDKCLRLGPFECPCCRRTDQISIHSDAYMGACGNCYLISDISVFAPTEDAA
jgi:hypothetical protein